MDGEARRTRVGLAALIVFVAALLALSGAAYLANSAPSPSGSSGSRLIAATPGMSASSGTYFDYVVVILMENHNLCDVYTHCGGSGTYETSLSDNYSIPLNDHYCNVNPSLPNYLCLSGASDFGCSGYDGSPNSNPCTSVAWNAPNIVDRLVSGGISWKAYMEDMTTNCQGSDTGNYAVRHDPFVYYSDNVNNATRCNLVVPAGPSAGSDSVFLNDLNSTSTASNYMWLTPNTLNDGHDTSVAYADAYLGNLVPKILASPVFTGKRAALFITYDEGYGQPTYATWAGPVVKHGYTSNTLYSHFSFLATVEANWNLPALNGTNDGAATPMSEFFTSGGNPDFSISANPTHLNLITGHVGNSTISVQAINGFKGSVSLSTSSSPSGVTASCNPSAITPGNTSTCSMSAANAGNYTVTVTGTSGSLTHAASITLTVIPPPPPLAGNFTFSPASPVVGQSISFSGSASGGVPPYSYAWTFGDGASASGSSVSHAYSTTGTFTVNLTVTDSTSSTAKVSKPVTVVPGPLTADFSFSPSNPSANQTVTFTASASGGTPPYSYAWTFGDSATATGSPATHAYTKAGNYTVTLTVTDASSSTKTANRTVTVSPAPTLIPTNLVMNPDRPDPSVDGQTVNISATLTRADTGAPISGATVVMQGSDDNGTTWWSAGTYVTNAAGTANGWVVFHYKSPTQQQRLRASYAGDSQFAASASNVISHVTSPAASGPVTTLQAAGTAGAHGWYTSNVTVTLTATDAANSSVTIHWQLDGGAWQIYTTPIVLGSGRHTLLYNATDGAGNQESTKTASFNVDTVAPTVTANLNGSAGMNGWYISTVQVTLAASDAMSGVDSISYLLDAGSWQVYTGPFNVGNGNHTLLYAALDLAGLGSGNQAVTVAVDTGTPIFTGLSPSGTVNASTVTASWSATDSAGVSQYQISVDGGAYRDVGTATSYQLSLTNGPHTVEILATDHAGRTATAVIQFQVDATAPPTARPPDPLLYMEVGLVGLGVILFAGLAVHTARSRRRKRYQR